MVQARISLKHPCLLDLQKANGDSRHRVDETDNPLVAITSSLVRTLRGVVGNTEDSIEGQVGTVGT